jgi:hypothetical protein
MQGRAKVIKEEEEKPEDPVQEENIRKESFGECRQPDLMENGNLEKDAGSLANELGNHQDILDLIVRDFINVLEEQIEKEQESNSGMMETEEQVQVLARGQSNLASAFKEITEGRTSKTQSYYDAGTFAPAYGDKNVIKVC